MKNVAYRAIGHLIKGVAISCNARSWRRTDGDNWTHPHLSNGDNNIFRVLLVNQYKRCNQFTPKLLLVTLCNNSNSINKPEQGVSS